MADDLVCVDCGATFGVPQDVATRYPGWHPKRCRRCHQRHSGKARPESGTAASAAGRSSRAGRSGRGGGRGPSPASAREVERTVAEVLATFAEGPLDGVFTDGAADPNPGPGGWGAVYVRDDDIVDEAWGHEARTTNNRMELTALIAGYDLVPDGDVATVYTDSRLAVDTITKWAHGWKARGWKRKTGEVENLDLVKALYERATARPEIELQWIRAHAGARWNEYADALATAYRREVR